MGKPGTVKRYYHEALNDRIEPFQLHIKLPRRLERPKLAVIESLGRNR